MLFNWLIPVRLTASRRQPLYNATTMLRLLFLGLLSVAGFAQTGDPVNVWTPRGPEGGVVGRPVIDPRSPGTLYVNNGWLWKTTDAAGHWSYLSAPPGAVLAVDPRNSSTLYGTNFYNALLKSTDGGLTWNPSDPLPCLGLTQFQPCINLSFVIDPANSSTLYVGHDTDYSLNGGMFKSTDGGATWNPAGNGLPVFPNKALPSVHALAIDPKNPGTLYAATGLYCGGRRRTVQEHGRRDELESGQLRSRPTIPSLTLR